MNRIQVLFKKKKTKVLSVYCTAGYPQLHQTEVIIKALSAQGADMIEIGIPFSDPIADGPTIQASNEVALKNGMTIALLFEQLKNIRSYTNIPLILMGYLNPVLKFGIEPFCSNAHEAGIDGLIIPDLPLHEYQSDFKPLLDKYGIEMIFLITPHTNIERIKAIDEMSDSFIYLVSTTGTTGRQLQFIEEQRQHFATIKQLHLKNPILAGFGISNKESFDTVCTYFNGGIIGSSFIRAITNNNNDIQTSITHFIQSII